ncbi:MAG: alanine racemase [Peptostreptococcales bacterium]
MNMNEIKWAEINIDNLIHNIKKVREHVDQETHIAAVIKANAYGHGALEIAHILLENGADVLAVSSVREAIEIRKRYSKAQTLVLGYNLDENIKEAIEYGVIQTVYSYEQAVKYSKMAEEIGMGISIHIKIDTGMNRIGFYTDAKALEEIIKISKLPNVKINGIFSHFAVADEKSKEFTYKQYERFTQFIKELEARNIKIPMKHIANSASLMDTPEMNMDMVRAGIILYGLYPSNEVSKDGWDLKPVMSLKTKVSHIKVLNEDGGISYGLLYHGKKDQRIATIPIGYADGYTRLLSGKSQVIIKGQRANIVGQICMDQCMVDISHIPDVKIGDEVLLFGTDGENILPVEELASAIGTINYEIVCMVGRRVPRIYIKDNRVVEIADYLK